MLLVNDWLLGTCGTVVDVKQRCPRSTCGPADVQESDLDPIHFAVHDARGNSIVIEYTSGKLHI